MRVSETLHAMCILRAAERLADSSRQGLGEGECGAQAGVGAVWFRKGVLRLQGLGSAWGRAWVLGGLQHVQGLRTSMSTVKDPSALRLTLLRRNSLFA